MEHPDPTVWEYAVQATFDLPNLKTCLRSQRLALFFPELPSARAAQLEAVRQKMAEARALGEVGKHELAVTVVESSARDAM